MEIVRFSGGVEREGLGGSLEGEDVQEHDPVVTRVGVPGNGEELATIAGSTALDPQR